MINMDYLAAKIGKVLEPMNRTIVELLQGITAEQRRTNTLLEALTVFQVAQMSQAEMDMAVELNEDMGAVPDGL